MTSDDLVTNASRMCTFQIREPSITSENGISSQLAPSPPSDRSSCVSPDDVETLSEASRDSYASPDDMETLSEATPMSDADDCDILEMDAATIGFGSASREENDGDEAELRASCRRPHGNMRIDDASPPSGSAYPI
mmetsp:Transcript_26911/g.60794  ORF Transcript_26911/g.60794 Transcript_26911/m.60794 type:complete len:136 (-) Transcript_26911:414-821(-)